MTQPQSKITPDAANQAQLRARGQITLPAEVRLQVGLREGDHVIVTVEDDRIILTPARLIPRDQAWFWTPEWQAGEREADADIAAGRGQVFTDDDEFTDYLKQIPPPGATD